jgi:hypothetical protein
MVFLSPYLHIIFLILSNSPPSLKRIPVGVAKFHSYSHLTVILEFLSLHCGTYMRTPWIKKGQCREIFYSYFLHQTTYPNPVGHALKGFRFFSNCRGALHIYIHSKN